jgi:hypothetical protein
MRVVGRLRSILQLRFYSMNHSPEGDLPEGVEFVECLTWVSTREVLELGGIEALSTYAERFVMGDRFVCLRSPAKLVLCYGWYTNRAMMPVSEIGFYFRTQYATVLFDFHTPEPFRRKGYYTHLLRWIMRQPSVTCGWIYALAENTASRRAIRKAGFRRRSILWLFATGRFCRLAK